MNDRVWKDVKGKAMNKLGNWIVHRSKVVRLAWPHGVADAAGVAPALLDSLAGAGNLEHVSRGARGVSGSRLKGERARA